MKKRLVSYVLFSVLAGCATYMGVSLDQRFGAEEPRERILPFDYSQAHYFESEVKPILDRRCVVCHACYDAPCQLKLTSAEGIDRGASTALVYEGTRLRATQPTRLYEDAFSTQQWRDLGFYPVLNERLQRADANIESGVMAQLLLQKEAHPLPTTTLLDNEVFTFGTDRKNVCSASDGAESYEEQHPLWGMPYALPGLENDEQQTLLAWLRQGASMSQPSPLSEIQSQAVAYWEAYLNHPSPKRQLTSRYIYEHLYLSHLYFSEQQELRFFNLVRSSTPPGEPVKRVVTRRPYEDPGIRRVYYRLIPERETIVDKTHMPYALNQQRMEKWQAWFDSENYEVTQLPGYDKKVASNPILAFAAIPIQSRYRFLLDEAQNTIMSYIKGPVCRGQLALNVINDHFWVFFTDPDLSGGKEATRFFESQAENMRLPGQLDSNTTPLLNWVRFSKSQSEYLSAKMNFMNQHFQDGAHLNIDMVWDGDGENPNAALTIFRHFDSASVIQGLVGKPPKTAWIIDYSLLERIHYLLVTGFDIYGNFGHQLITRMYMDLLRIEGESNFIALLPKESRHQTLSSWYQGQSIELQDYLTRNTEPFNQDSGVTYQTANPKLELQQRLKQRLAPVHSPRYEIANTSLSAASERQLQYIADLRGGGVQHFPQIMLLEITSETGKPHLFTLLHNNAHTNISSLFNEESNRQPEFDTLTLINGVLGSYPAAFLSLSEAQIPELVQIIKGIKDEKDYQALLDRFAIRRTDGRFWSFSDRIHAWYQQDQPIEFGLLDYNRFENR